MLKLLCKNTNTEMVNISKGVGLYRNEGKLEKTRQDKLYNIPGFYVTYV